MLAAARGMSKAQYLRHLIIADAQDAEKPEISVILGGGGDITKLAALLEMSPRELYNSYCKQSWEAR